MKSLVLLVLLVAVASAAYTHSYLRGSYHAPSYRPYTRYSHYTHASPHHYTASYHRLHKREAEAEPEAEAEADPGTYVYNTVPYVYNPYYAPVHKVDPLKVKSTAVVPSVYSGYYPHYLPYGGAYGHHTYGFNPYTINPYHPQYVLKPVEADEPTAATSEDDSETVEISRKRREAEAEPEAEADPAKVVTHHVPAAVYPYTAYSHAYPYTHLSPKFAHVAPTVKYVAPVHHKTYSAYPYTHGYPYSYRYY